MLVDDVGRLEVEEVVVNVEDVPDGVVCSGEGGGGGNGGGG